MRQYCFLQKSLFGVWNAPNTNFDSNISISASACDVVLGTESHPSAHIFAQSSAYSSSWHGVVTDEVSQTYSP